MEFGGLGRVMVGQGERWVRGGCLCKSSTVTPEVRYTKRQKSRTKRRGVGGNGRQKPRKNKSKKTDVREEVKVQRGRGERDMGDRGFKEGLESQYTVDGSPSFCFTCPRTILTTVFRKSNKIQQRI